MRLKTCRVEKGGCGKVFKTFLKNPSKCTDCNTMTNKKLTVKAMIKKLLKIDLQLDKLLDKKMKLEDRRRNIIIPRLKRNKKLRKSIDKWRNVLPSKFRPTLEAIFFEIFSTEEPEKVTGLEVRAIIIKLAKRKGFKKVRKSGSRKKKK